MLGAYVLGTLDQTHADSSGMIKPETTLQTEPAIHALVDDFIHTFNRMASQSQALTCEDRRYYPALSTKAGSALASMRVVQNEPDEGIVDVNTLYNELITTAHVAIIPAYF